MCVNGDPVLENCSPGTYWNPDNNTCDFPDNVDTSNCNEPTKKGEEEVKEEEKKGKQ